MKTLIWKYCPTFLLKILVFLFGSFRSKEKMGMLKCNYYAYGLISAADLAKKHNVDSIWALEFGVASGRGLYNLITLAQMIKKETNVNIRIAGFDTGKGMPISNDFRDHPDKYQEGDYPMVNEQELKNNIKGKAELILGDIENTVEKFTKKLTPRCPIGFISIDVDTYTATVSSLKLFKEKNSEVYLPMVFSYFDDSGSRSHFSKFTGELLAIDEFNTNSEMRKIDIDRGVRNSHPNLNWQSWFERMFVTHIFDHSSRYRKSKRQTKFL